MTSHAMRVRMLRGTGGPDGLALEAGEVYDLPRPVALHYLSIGRAEVVEEPTEPATPVLDTRPLKPKRTR